MPPAGQSPACRVARTSHLRLVIESAFIDIRFAEYAMLIFHHFHDGAAPSIRFHATTRPIILLLSPIAMLILLNYFNSKSVVAARASPPMLAPPFRLHAADCNAPVAGAADARD